MSKRSGRLVQTIRDLSRGQIVVIMVALVVIVLGAHRVRDDLRARAVTETALSAQWASSVVQVQRACAAPAAPAADTGSAFDRLWSKESTSALNAALDEGRRSRCEGERVEQGNIAATLHAMRAQALERTDAVLAYSDFAVALMGLAVLYLWFAQGQQAGDRQD